jgi:hypothetical protein
MVEARPKISAKTPSGAGWKSLQGCFASLSMTPSEQIFASLLRHDTNSSWDTHYTNSLYSMR